MEFKLDATLGYMYAYAPGHYLANKAGKVYEHIYVMCEAIGRPLNDDECVHHENRDKTDNRLSNLRLMTKADHAKLHYEEDRDIVYVQLKCPTCSVDFEATKNSGRMYCSVVCASQAKVKFEVSREDLELMVWSMPTVQVAKLLGVSDVAVAKRCKKMGIPKPPRGYWAKLTT